MKKIIFLGLLFCSAGLFSQTLGGIKGTVTDQAMDNEPLLMANIQLKGQDSITQSNFHGNFEISKLTEGTHTLVISYLGYETKELSVTIKENEVTTIAAFLNPIQFDLGDVAGMDTAFKETDNFSSTIEKDPRK